MNKEQKANFLKRLTQGKASLKEITSFSPFDQSIPILTWRETERNVYTNVSGEYFDKKGIKPRELVLPFDEFRAYIKAVGRYRIFIWGKPLLTGEIDAHADKKNWIIFK